MVRQPNKSGKILTFKIYPDATAEAMNTMRSRPGLLCAYKHLLCSFEETLCRAQDCHSTRATGQVLVQW